MISLLSLERKHKNHSNPFRTRIFLVLSYSFGIEKINTFIHSVVPSKPYPIPDQNGQGVYPFSDQNGAKTQPDHVCNSHDFSVLQSIEKEKEKIDADHS